MSLSIEIVGFMEPTDDYERKRAAYHACDDAGIPIPDELEAFFQHETPSREGMVVDISGAVVGRPLYEGAKIYLSKLPEGVVRIDVVAS